MPPLLFTVLYRVSACTIFKGQTPLVLFTVLILCVCYARIASYHVRVVCLCLHGTAHVASHDSYNQCSRADVVSAPYATAPRRSRAEFGRAARSAATCLRCCHGLVRARAHAVWRARQGSGRQKFGIMQPLYAWLNTATKSIRACSSVRSGQERNVRGHVPVSKARCMDQGQAGAGAPHQVKPPQAGCARQARRRGSGKLGRERDAPRG